MKDWRTEGKKKFDEAREALRYLCEPVPQPHELEQYLHYFCGDANDPNALNTTEPLRISFYKATATLLRAYAAIAGNLEEAGYSTAEIAALEKETQFYADTRAAIKKHSGEELDIKPYEADMRHLLNTYIQADPAAELGSLSQLPLTEMIIETGVVVQKTNQVHNQPTCPEIHLTQPSLFKGRHFDSSIIILCVRWYITYKLSYRDLRDMMAERGVTSLIQRS